MSKKPPVKLAALQLNEQGASLSRLDYYLRICKAENARLVVLGEYVLQPFFKSLIKQPIREIADNAKARKEAISELCAKHELSMLAPFINAKSRKLVKGLALFLPDGGFKFIEQNALISYSHWDEESFYANRQTKVSLPVFRHEGLKVGAMSGYEAHFDECWQFLLKKGAELIIVPCVNTFSSNERWEALLRARALCYGVSVLRVGRVGAHSDDDGSRWEFYGDSMLISPSSEVLWRLGASEELGIASISPKGLAKERTQWGFRAKARQKGWL